MKETKKERKVDIVLRVKKNKRQLNIDRIWIIEDWSEKKILYKLKKSLTKQDDVIVKDKNNFCRFFLSIRYLIVNC